MPVRSRPDHQHEEADASEANNASRVGLFVEIGGQIVGANSLRCLLTAFHANDRQRDFPDQDLAQKFDAIFWRSLTTAMGVPRQSSPAKSPSNIGMTSSATPPSATQFWTASFTMLTAFNSPEKACENRTPAIKLLTSSQTPEPITMSVEAAAHDRAKSLLTIKRNERSPSREIAAHNQRNVQRIPSSGRPLRGMI